MTFPPIVHPLQLPQMQMDFLTMCLTSSDLEPILEPEPELDDEEVGKPYSLRQ